MATKPAAKAEVKNQTGAQYMNEMNIGAGVVTKGNYKANKLCR